MLDISHSFPILSTDPAASILVLSIVLGGVWVATGGAGLATGGAHLAIGGAGLITGGARLAIGLEVRGLIYFAC